MVRFVRIHARAGSPWPTGPPLGPASSGGARQVELQVVDGLPEHGLGDTRDREGDREHDSLRAGRVGATVRMYEGIFTGTTRSGRSKVMKRGMRATRATATVAVAVTVTTRRRDADQDVARRWWTYNASRPTANKNATEACDERAGNLVRQDLLEHRQLRQVAPPRQPQVIEPRGRASGEGPEREPRAATPSHTNSQVSARIATNRRTRTRPWRKRGGPRDSPADATPQVAARKTHVVLGQHAVSRAARQSERDSPTAGDRGAARHSLAETEPGRMHRGNRAAAAAQCERRQRIAGTLTCRHPTAVDGGHTHQHGKETTQDEDLGQHQVTSSARPGAVRPGRRDVPA